MTWHVFSDGLSPQPIATFFLVIVVIAFTSDTSNMYSTHKNTFHWLLKIAAVSTGPFVAPPSLGCRFGQLCQWWWDQFAAMSTMSGSPWAKHLRTCDRKGCVEIHTFCIRIVSGTHYIPFLFYSLYLSVVLNADSGFFSGFDGQVQNKYIDIDIIYT